MKTITKQLETNHLSLYQALPEQLTFSAFLKQMNKTIILLIALFITLFTMQSCNKDDSSPLEGAEYEQLNSAMRVLWSDHALWTRNVIINIVDGAPGTTEAVNRLLKNQEDIGNCH